jgi:hypothetical protein
LGVTLSKPAEYKGDPERVVERRVFKEDGSKPWRDTYRDLTKPSPSVT